MLHLVHAQFYVSEVLVRRTDCKLMWLMTNSFLKLLLNSYILQRPGFFLHLWLLLLRLYLVVTCRKTGTLLTAVSLGLAYSFYPTDLVDWMAEA